MKNLSGSKTLESMSQAIWYNRWTLAKFSNYLNGQILEVGCGIGNFTKFLIKYGQVTAIDINKDYIRQAEKNVADKAQIGFGDIEKGKYFFKNKYFDSIVCLNVLEHIQNDQKAISNIYKSLKKEGNLVLLVPAHPFLMGEIDKAIGHYRRYQFNELINLLSHFEFNILFATKINFLGAIGWFVAGKIFKKKYIDSNQLQLFNIFAPFFLSLEDRIGIPIGTSILIVAQKKT